MKYTKKALLILLFLSILVVPAFSENHIRELDKIRSSIIQQGNDMPEIIKSARGSDIRTLERIYELNTSALTTIEAYFKMLKVVARSGMEITPDVVVSLNEWLEFITNQCTYDLEYLDEVMSTAKEGMVFSQIRIAADNMNKLHKTTKTAILENEALLEGD